MRGLSLGLVCLATACGRGFFDVPPVDVDAATHDSSASTDAAPALTGNVVFATSGTTNGELGGLSGADGTCNALATQAGLPGTYVAYLSSSTTSAISRLAGSRGWQRVDGLPVIDNPSQLTNLRPWYPVALDEHGNDVRSPNNSAWTGADPTGALVGDACVDWTNGTSSDDSVFGSVSAGNGDLTEAGDFSCDQPARLYCFGVGNHAVSAPAPVAGRLAFISSAVFVPGTGGVATADALCQAEAMGAGKSGTFLAALPTTTASTASRFATTGLPWVRPDGVALTATAADMFAATFWRTQLAQTIDGSPATHNPWGGDPNAVASAGESCVEWTATSASARYGNANETNATRFSTGLDVCSTTAHSLLCLEE